ncbi:MAG: hemolysin III family protein [Clostridia bacterium]|nr:hemolysin III family protein [Clostridia bacterium]
MKRTKLRDRLLPDYTKGEEITNMVSHIIGGAAGVIVLALCLILSIWQKDGWKIVTGTLYGLSFIQLYTISSVYHGLKPGMGKKVLQVIDHCSIYFFIAGTYTPILLCLMRPLYPGWAWTIFGIVWGLTALAATLTAIDLKKYKVLSMACYIGMGWCIVIALKPLLHVMALSGFMLLLAGGVLYTIGSVLYGLGKKHRYMHSIFHFFVLAGSVLQALCILLYVF